MLASAFLLLVGLLGLPALAWAAVIFILTMMPGKYIPPVNIWNLANLDKLVHLSIFVVLIVLALYGFLKQQAYRVLREHPAAIAFVLCAGWIGIHMFFKDLKLSAAQAEGCVGPDLGILALPSALLVLSLVAIVLSRKTRPVGES